MSFAKAIRPHVSEELERATAALDRGEPARAFTHLERAHVLGQSSTREHVRVHWNMFRWALRERRAAEVFGQIVRIVGAATKTFVGLVPTGNTGGSNISAFRRLPVPRDLEDIIQNAMGEL